LNILIITPRIPYPPFRGDKLKIYNLAKNLSENNSVTILTFLRSTNQLNDLANFDKFGIKVKTIKLSIFESIINTAIAIFSRLPFQAAWYKSAKMNRKVAELCSSGEFDVVYYHLIRSAQYFHKSMENGKPLNILDFTDAVSLYLKRFAEVQKNPLIKFLIKVEQKRVVNYEKIAEKFHALFICSEVDKKYLIDSGLNIDIRILNNGIDIDYFQPEKIKCQINRIIFTGNMPYFANYDAAIYFAEVIFPKILREIPDAEFYIVGQKPPLKIRNLASKNIFVTGFVPDIKLEYLKSAVNVAPMRFGAGTLNKVIESIALGVPVVGTPFAVNGLPKELYKFISVADDEDSFAGQVVTILKNPKIREELLEEGKKVIRNILSWKNVVSGFESYLAQEILKVSGKGKLS
jgi:sugar transferase (PEP-CTERM/EpsH1 system associated)